MGCFPPLPEMKSKQTEDEERRLFFRLVITPVFRFHATAVWGKQGFPIPSHALLRVSPPPSRLLRRDGSLGAPTLGLAEVEGVVSDGHPPCLSRIHLAPRVIMTLFVAPALGRLLFGWSRLLTDCRRHQKHERPKGHGFRYWPQPPPPTPPPPRRLTVAREPAQQPRGLHGEPSRCTSHSPQHGKTRNCSCQAGRRALKTAASGGGTPQRPSRPPGCPPPLLLSASWARLQGRKVF